MLLLRTAGIDPDADQSDEEEAGEDDEGNGHVHCPVGARK